jgi:hypothetical protein
MYCFFFCVVSFLFLHVYQIFPPRRNPIAVNIIYHIISYYIILHHIIYIISYISYIISYHIYYIISYHKTSYHNIYRRISIRIFLSKYYYQVDKVKDDEIFRLQAWLTWVKYEMHIKFWRDNLKESRSQWQCGLRLRSAAARLLSLWVQILPGALKFVCCNCCVL